MEKRSARILVYICFLIFTLYTKGGKNLQPSQSALTNFTY